MRFQLKSLIFVTAMAAVLIAWFLDHRTLKQDAIEARQSAIESANALKAEREGQKRLRDSEREAWKRDMERVQAHHKQSVARLLEQFNSRLKASSGNEGVD